MVALPAQLETSRLILRAWGPEDAEALRAALDASDAHLRPWIPFMQTEPRTLAATQAWLLELAAAFAEGSAARWAIWGPAGDLLGEVMLLDRVGPDALELGYWLHRDHTGQGYATEAARAVVQAGFQSGIHRVVIRCDANNAPSNAVAARLGAEETGTEHVGAPLPGTLRVWTVSR